MAGGNISWMLAFSLLKLTSCNRATCTPSVVELGKQAVVFCNFNASESVEHITVYKLNGHFKGPKKSIVECSTFHDSKCNHYGNYVCECNSPDLVLTIPSMTANQSGKYLCQTLPTGDYISCVLKLKDETQDCTVELVCVGLLAAIPALLLLLLLLLIAYKKRKWIQSKCRRNARGREGAGREHSEETQMKPLIREEPNAEMSKPLGLLIIGKSGNGKTSTHNTTLENNLFEKQNVMDTPEICQMTREQRKEEVERWKKFISNTRCAILLAVRCDVSYGHDDYEIYRDIKHLWGDSSPFCQRLVVAFTFGDRLQRPIQEQLTAEASEELERVLKDANRRYVVFNNEASQEEKQETVQSLWSLVANLCPEDILSGASCERSNGDNSGQHVPGPDVRQRQKHDAQHHNRKI